MYKQVGSSWRSANGSAIEVKESQLLDKLQNDPLGLRKKQQCTWYNVESLVYENQDMTWSDSPFLPNPKKRKQDNKNQVQK